MLRDRWCVECVERGNLPADGHEGSRRELQLGVVSAGDGDVREGRSGAVDLDLDERDGPVGAGSRRRQAGRGRDAAVVFGGGWDGGWTLRTTAGASSVSSAGTLPECTATKAEPTPNDRLGVDFAEHGGDVPRRPIRRRSRLRRRAGTYGSGLVLTTSGGSGTGAVSYSVVDWDGVWMFGYRWCVECVGCGDVPSDGDEGPGCELQLGVVAADDRDVREGRSGGAGGYVDEGPRVRGWR